VLTRTIRFGAWLALLTCGCGETIIAITDRSDGGTDTGEPSVDLERGLLAYLPLDEAEAGALSLDVSGNEHHGVPSESPPTPSFSVPPTGFTNSRSLEFSGAEQFLDLGNPPGLDLEGPVTLAAWVRPRALDGLRNIVAHGWHREPDQELVLRVQDNIDQVIQPVALYGFVAWDGSNHAALAPIPEGDVDAWHHLCGVYDGTSYRLYRNGELIAEQADDVAPMRVEAPWAIGARGMPDRTAPETYDARYFDGMIDDVRIYGRALSPEEARALARR
jgi:hypothetical protein